MDGRIEDEAAFADVVAAGLELRLHERDHVGPRRQHRRDYGQDVSEGDERHVDRDNVSGARQVGGFEKACVDVLEHDDARIGAKPPIELTVSDIQGDDLTGATLEQHIGEAACRSANVERGPAAHLDRERLERVRKLETTAAHIGVVGCDQRDVCIARDAGARLRNRGPVHAHLAGHDQGAGALARRGELAFDEEEIEALAGHGSAKC
jgi:hypothetical protein